MQTTSQEKEKNKKQMISLILLVCTIIIGFFFTIDLGYGYIEKKDTAELTKKEVTEKKGALEKLEEMKKNIITNAALQNDIGRYGYEFRENEIIDSLFASMNGISIASIAMSKGEKSPNGLSIATISLSLKAQDINSLYNFLIYLTSSKINKKSYIINSLDFPLDTTKNEPISVSLSLGMYYFE